MAFSSAVVGNITLGGCRMIYGTWNSAGVTTGTIDIRGAMAGTAVSVPYDVIWADATNCTTGQEPDALLSKTGTMAITATSGDTGTFIFITH